MERPISGKMRKRRKSVGEVMAELKKWREGLKANDDFSYGVNQPGPPYHTPHGNRKTKGDKEK